MTCPDHRCGSRAAQHSVRSASRYRNRLDGLRSSLKVEGETNRTQDNAPANSQLGAAMLEAANAIDRRYQPLLDMKQADPGASMEAAIATAAHDILVADLPSK